jgi:spermidine synthase
MIYLFTFILAFCSMAYELLLGQSLSAFLGNTVLRYSVTIGLYMLSMGIGSLMAEGRFVKSPVTALLKIELLLTVTGGFSVIALLVIDSAGLPPLLFSALAHSLIIIIGIFTGFEIPLLMHLKNLETKQSESTVLGVDYLGAFFGTVVFAFVFYPIVGLIPTAFFVATLNAAVGVALLTQTSKVQSHEHRQYRTLIAVQSVLLIVLVACLSTASTINELFLRQYLES